jgi:hypothetical protein
MGILPVLKRQPDFPRESIGYSQSAFFGGRTSVNIRRVVCPRRVHGFSVDVLHGQFLDVSLALRDSQRNSHC